MCRIAGHAQHDEGEGDDGQDRDQRSEQAHENRSEPSRPFLCRNRGVVARHEMAGGGAPVADPCELRH